MQAIVAFPGGQGPLDEPFEALTPIQTHRMQPIPVVPFGRDCWSRFVDRQMFVDKGTIAPEHLELVHHAETARECWRHISSSCAHATTERRPHCQ